MERGSVVFFHAHPDDEAIFTGGSIALLASNGWRVVVVVATAGELGDDDDALASRELGGTRVAETMIAAGHLGASRVEFLGYRDSGMAGHEGNTSADAFACVPVADAARRLADILDEECASALVVYDDAGIYGHPDHVQVHRVGVEAARLAGVATLYEATVDREYLHYVETHLVGHAIAGLEEPAPLGVPTVMVSTTLDVRAALERKRAAMAAHASQIRPGSAVLTMDAPTFAAVYGVEWYVRAGPPGPLEAQVTNRSR